MKWLLTFSYTVALLTTSRVALGFVQGGVFPACFQLICLWLPRKERTVAFGFIDFGINIGAIISAPMTGYLSEHGFAGGWPSSFYVAGLIAFVVATVFASFVTSRPDNNRFVSFEELEKIKDRNTEDCCNETKPPIPVVSDIIHSTSCLTYFSCLV